MIVKYCSMVSPVSTSPNQSDISLNKTQQTYKAPKQTKKINCILQNSENLKTRIQELENKLQDQIKINKQLLLDKQHLANQLKRPQQPQQVIQPKQPKPKTREVNNSTSLQIVELTQENVQLRTRLQQQESNQQNFQKVLQQKLSDFQARERQLIEKISFVEGSKRENHPSEQVMAQQLAQSEQRVQDCISIIKELRVENSQYQDDKTALISKLEEMNKQLEDKNHQLQQKQEQLQIALDLLGFNNQPHQTNQELEKKFEEIQKKIEINQGKVNTADEVDDEVEVDLDQLGRETNQLYANLHEVEDENDKVLLERIKQLEEQTFNLQDYLGGV